MTIWERLNIEPSADAEVCAYFYHGEACTRPVESSDLCLSEIALLQELLVAVEERGYHRGRADSERANAEKGDAE